MDFPNAYDLSALFHYLDDFITAGPPDLPQCGQNLQTAMSVCQRLGLPLHPGKCVGPSQVLTVLGIELDSVEQIARLPADELQALNELITSWLPRKWCHRRELESLIGHLHHAAKVVLPGRTLLRRMIDLLKCFRKRNHPIRLKVTVYLQRCLASKRFSAPALNCRYLNPYIKLKLIELAIKLYEEF